MTKNKFADLSADMLADMVMAPGSWSLEVKEAIAAKLRASAAPADDDIAALQRAYAKGWRRSAEWANRDDLCADIGSPAYLKDMAADLAPLVCRTSRPT